MQILHALEEPLPASEERGDEAEQHLVDESGAQVLPGGRRTATQEDVAVPRRVPRLLQRRFDSVRDEGEGGPTLELEPPSWMVRQDEDGMVKGRIRSPPAVPRFRGIPRPGVTPNMFRPIERGAGVGERLRDDPAVLVLDPTGLPCILRKAAVGKAHSCSRMPPTPSGSFTLWCGPATKPSSDIDIRSRSFGIRDL